MITVNKHEHEWRDGMTIQSLLEEKNFTFPRIVVKVNGKLVKKQNYSSYKIQNGDRIDRDSHDWRRLRPRWSPPGRRAPSPLDLEVLVQYNKAAVRLRSCLQRIQGQGDILFFLDFLPSDQKTPNFFDLYRVFGNRTDRAFIFPHRRSYRQHIGFPVRSQNCCIRS